MKKTIIVNNGSTSKKYAVYEGEKFLAFFYYEKTHNSFLRSENWETNKDWDKTEEPVDQEIYDDAFVDLINHLLTKNIIDSVDDIDKVAIRIVAPGDFFQEHKIIDKDYLLELDDVLEKSPLHIRPVKDEIDEILENIPKIKLVGISDSAFHQTMSQTARTYALPNDLVKKLGLSRYGYHGISVGSIVRELENKKRSTNRAIVCHLGGGSSITAIKEGKSIDTTMGYSPLGGLPMSTRSGSIDANALITIMDDEDLTTSELQTILYKQSGLKGMTGSGDTKEVLKMAREGNSNAELALDLYTYSIAKFIAGYYVALGGLDTLVFTGTIGERSSDIRTRVLGRLEVLGIIADKSKNKLQIKGPGEITGDESAAKIYVMPTAETEEMLKIANDF